MSPLCSFASSIACLIGAPHLWMIGSTISSSFARVSVVFRWSGPDAVAVMNGRLMSVVSVVESSIFAFSAASLSLCAD